MVSHQHRFIFIHIPKTAGTSIEDAFDHFSEFKGRGGQDHRTIRDLEPLRPEYFLTPDAGRYRDLGRRYANRLRNTKNPANRIYVNADQYQDYFKFSFVRNPWSRAVSWYKNVIRDEIHRAEFKIPENISFKEFIIDYPDNWGLKPQTHWLKSFNGDYPLDFVGRFESLESDFKEACAKIGSPPNISLPHKIKGNGVDYRTFFDQESVEILAERYSEEIDFFGYSFDE